MDTIKSNEEISKIFSIGKRFSNPYMVFIVTKQRKPLSKIDENSKHDLNGRVAFIAGKKLGNAVWRNSAKRRLREIYRNYQGFLGKFDILLVARSPLLNASYSKVLDTCEQTLGKMKKILEVENGQSG